MIGEKSINRIDHVYTHGVIVQVKIKRYCAELKNWIQE